MRNWLAAWLLALGACLLAIPAQGVAAEAESPEGSFRIQVLDPSVSAATAALVINGSLDGHFVDFDFAAVRRRQGAFWLKLRAEQSSPPGVVPTLNISKGRHLQIQAFDFQQGRGVPLRLATHLPGFRGMHQAVFALPDQLNAGQILYVQVDPQGHGWEGLQLTSSTLPRTLATGAEHARMIALAFGALMAMALASLLIWLVLSDKLLLLYASLFSLQALYIAYLSGQGFEWPLLSYGLPVIAYKIGRAHV